jgi:nitroreductase
LAVTDKQVRDELSAINAGKDPFKRADPFYNAPCVLVVLADKSVFTSIYDGTLVMENMMLAAHALGLGACWIHRAKETFEQPEWKAFLKKLGIEGEYEGIGNCVVGYPEGEVPAVKPRKEGRVYYV